MTQPTGLAPFRPMHVGGLSRRGRAIAFVLAFTVLSAPASAAVPMPRDEPTHLSGDWLAACDNLLDCTEYGFVAGDVVAAIVVARPRGAAPRASLIVVPDRGTRPASLRLQPARRGPPVTLRLAPDLAGVWRATLSAGEVAILLAALRAGGRLAVQAPVSHGWTGIGIIRPAGAAVLADWVDARQRRAPLPIPLVRPADEPAFPGTGPETRRLPAQVAALGAVRICRRDDADDPVDDDAAWTISTGITLWSIPCGAGNFDRESLFVQQDDRPDAARPVVFALPGGVAGRAPGVLVNAEVAADGRSVTATEPSRGLGDCGDQRVYDWDGERFRLVQARSMPVCRGLPPEDWPVIYRSQTLPPGAR